MSRHLPDPSSDFEAVEQAFADLLDQSLEPRGVESLYELVRGLGIPSGGLVVDVGCGSGRDAVQLASRFGLRVHGVDPEQGHVDAARTAAESAGLAAATRYSLGTAEDLPLPDASADMVWCKEVLMFTDPQRAFASFFRVLRPGGAGLVSQVLSGPRMSDAEARSFWETELGYGPARSLRARDIEMAIASATLTLQRRIDFGGEWGELAEERTGSGGRRLLHAARLLRDPARYVSIFGELNYRIMLGDCMWHVYRMIGKLSGVAIVFTKPS